MKKAFFTFVLLLAAATMSAQSIVKGDMNDDGALTISDVTTAVNVILGNAPQQTINTFSVDNSPVVGTWYAPDGSEINFNADGTTNYPSGATYEYMPLTGNLLIYDVNNTPMKVLPIVKATSGYLLTVNYATNTFVYYTKRSPSAYVDLGLPSGTLWATCNVGANSPEEYGDYFAWGETKSKNFYSFSNYALCDGTATNMTKYNATDGKTQLEPVDDAATVNIGPDWCMPTSEQFNELINNCSISSQTINEVEGYLFTSNRNENTIFLPFSGLFYYKKWYDSQSKYWTSTLYKTTQPESAFTANLNNNLGTYDTSGTDRYFGCCVRAVRKNTEITDLTMSQNILNMNTGSTAQLTAIVTPTGAINKTVTWSSSNTSVATVSQSGLVTANAAGSCTITARSVADNTLTATCTITVTNVPVTSIRIVGWSDGNGLATGQTVQLTAIVEPANATNKSVIWTSDRTHVVTIDENGLATCVYQSPDNIGTNFSIITATAADGSGVSASVTMFCWSN